VRFMATFVSRATPRRICTSADSRSASLRGVRAPETGVTGRIALGTWRYRGGKDFAALYGGKPAVIVHLRDAPFRRLLVSADDAEPLAAAIAPRQPWR